MKLGCCGSPDQANVLSNAGFEFIEVNIQSVLDGDKEDGPWVASAPDVDRLPLPILAANCLIPGKYPIVGPDRDPGRLSIWMQRVAQRAARLGIEQLVFGSGGARKRPDDVTPEEADDQIAQFLHIAGDACQEAGVTLVIEHLRRGEVNTLNMLDEVAVMLDRVPHPAIHALVDSYHFALNDDRLEALERIAPRIRHVHVAEPAGRQQPGAPAEGQPYDFAAFFAPLKRAAYDGGISFEGTWAAEPAEAGPAVVKHLRAAWDAA